MKNIKKSLFILVLFLGIQFNSNAQTVNILKLTEQNFIQLNESTPLVDTYEINWEELSFENEKIEKPFFRSLCNNSVHFYFNTETKTVKMKLNLTNQPNWGKEEWNELLNDLKSRFQSSYQMVKKN